MRVVLGYATEQTVPELRRVLLGAGLDCEGADCVPVDALGVRLSRQNPDLIVVEMKPDTTYDWNRLRESLALTSAPVLGLAPTATTGEWKEEAQRAGIGEWFDTDQFHRGLDQVVQRMVGSVARRGQIVSVYRPLEGSGGATLALHLAGVLASRKNATPVGLLEVTRAPGRVGLLLDVQSPHTTDILCNRWDRLDRHSLLNCFAQHASGLRLLGADLRVGPREPWSVDAIRRIGLLGRLTLQTMVLALDAVVGDVEAEALRMSDAVLVVLRPDVPSVRRTRWFLETALDRQLPVERFHLVLNAVGQSGQLKQRQVEETLERSCAAVLPYDPGRVLRAANEGVLLQTLAPRATITTKLNHLAGQLVPAAK